MGKQAKLNTLSFAAGTYTIREETYQNRTHIVVPVVMMREGVHSGSHGPLLHYAEDLGAVVGSWNGIPVTVQHPSEDGNNISANSPEQRELAVGVIFNSHMDGDKLKAEAWLDIENLESISPEALAAIRNGHALDVSVGVFCEEEESEGTWNNESYVAIARNFRPDHLALLPGADGACSWSDGCGIRNNAKGGTNQMEDLLKTLKEVNQKGFAVTPINFEMGYGESERKAQRLLDAMDNDIFVYYLEEMFDNYLVYRVRNRADGTTKLYRRNYSIDAAENVALTGDPVEVRRNTEYLTLKRVRTKPVINKEDKEMTECCKKQINALIANTQSKFEESDRTWLETLEESQVEKLVPNVVKAPETVAAPTVNKEKALEVLSDSLKTDADFLALMPAEMKARFEAGIQVNADMKTKMVEGILANSEKDVWLKEDLDAMPMETLKKIAQTAKAPVDYSGMGTGAEESSITDNAGAEEPMGMIGVGKVEDK